MAGGQKNARVFGQAVRSKPTRGSGGSSSAATRYQRQMGQGRNLPRNLAATDVRGNQVSEEEELAARRAEARRKRKAEGEAFDSRFGYGRYDKRALKAAKTEPGAAKAEPGAKKESAAAAAASSSAGGSRRGWIFNMLPTVS